MKTCHNPKTHFTERKSNCGARLFTCKCGKKWSWTDSAGYYQQGRRRVENPKSEVITKRATIEERKAIRDGRADLVIVWRENNDTR